MLQELVAELEDLEGIIINQDQTEIFRVVEVVDLEVEIVPEPRVAEEKFVFTTSQSPQQLERIIKQYARDRPFQQPLIPYLQDQLFLLQVCPLVLTNPIMEPQGF